MSFSPYNRLKKLYQEHIYVFTRHKYTLFAAALSMPLIYRKRILITIPLILGIVSKYYWNRDQYIRTEAETLSKSYKLSNIVEKNNKDSKTDNKSDNKLCFIKK